MPAPFDDWLATPAGRYLLEWEQAQLDRAVADLFGFHALQLGLPALQALRHNRMPHRWLAATAALQDGPSTSPPDDGVEAAHRTVSLCCDFEALPFPSASVDLVVLPHALELAADPHQTLREVERVLVPEGRVLVLGFNPASLWGLRQRAGLLRLRLGARQPPFRPPSETMGYRRVRDWLRLLGFEVEGGRFGCYRPPVHSQRWLQRFGWMEPAGDRWWPVFGAAFLLVAVKRVRAMRLVGLAKREKRAPAVAPAVAAHRHHRLTPGTSPDMDRQEAHIE
ncbi:class I SAM-dependent methyltransferase [Aquabacterium sp. J223]|uniref:class I SAM-dependent methyltransferase n=1 Tax=Aquabacterium sp. J223 TaxID=2898431 RepID=UPI0021ADDA04|nr:class I SAM-dependent methyltransferase [Aquabacterium sp. J223]UUX97739.1 class I SAM-dependent methyltransferase [Aquabacterium sp. J223]